MTSGSLTSSGSKDGTDIAGLNAFLARRRRCVEMVLSAEESKQGAGGLDSNGVEGARTLLALLGRRRRCVEMVLSAEETKQSASGLDSNGLEGDRGIGWMFSLSSMFLNISLRR